MPERAKAYMGRQQPATGSHLPFGRHCFALRGRTIRVVAFRASHPAKPPPRQRGFIQRFLNILSASAYSTLSNCRI